MSAIVSDAEVCPAVFLLSMVSQVHEFSMEMTLIASLALTFAWTIRLLLMNLTIMGFQTVVAVVLTESEGPIGLAIAFQEYLDDF